MKKITHIVTLFYFLVNSTTLSAQEWKWATGSATIAENVRPGIGVMESSPIAVDRKGNAYEIGWGSWDNPPVSSIDTLKSTFGRFVVIDSTFTASQGILVSTDSNGAYRWAIGTQTGTVKFLNIVTDTFNNVYVSGIVVNNNFTFGSKSYRDTGENDYFCIKINSSGDVLWIKDLAHGAKEASAISVDKAGNLYLAGWFFDTSITIGATILTNAAPGDTTSDVFYAMYDSSGNPVWAKSFGASGNEKVFAVAATGNGELNIAGYFTSGSLAIGNDTLTISGIPSPFFVARFSPSGNPLWARKINERYFMNQSINGITVDELGNDYMVGSCEDSFAFGADTLPNPMGPKMFLAKYDSSGNAKWVRAPRYPGFGYSLAVDLCGNIWTSAGMESIVDSLFLSEFDSSGNLENTVVINSGGDDQNAIAVDDRGDLYVGGDYTYNNPLIAGRDTLFINDSSQESLFVLKYKYDYPGCVPDHSEETQQVTKTQVAELMIYPNPATDECTIHSDVIFNDGSRLQIFDITGRLVSKYPLSGNDTIIPVGNLLPGIYECRIYNNGFGVETKKLVVIR